MAAASADPHTIDTLGKLADNGMGLAWYCADCKRKLGLDLDEAIRRWGRDQVLVQLEPRIICDGCGSRSISMRVRENKTIKQGIGTPFGRPKSTRWSSLASAKKSMGRRRGRN